MAVIGYMRQSHLKDKALQKEIKNKYLCTKLFIEQDEMGNDEELRNMMKEIQPNDWIVIPNLKTFGKSIKQLESFVGELEEKEVRLTLIEEGIDTTKFDFYKVFSSIVSMEYFFSVHQIKKGLKNAKENGKICGRPRVSKEKIQQIVDCYLKYGGSFQMIADKCDVSVGTVHKYVHQHEKGILS